MVQFDVPPEPLASLHVDFRARELRSAPTDCVLACAGKSVPETVIDRAEIEARISPSSGKTLQYVLAMIVFSLPINHL
jgi:hypothetical protein